ncbi:hypothetical protein GGU11DRAFT_746258 [Lentinula aff. detonsa]|nr:hypothetical protein GGU11DRAFT_746258 [Lentinula aff. detonsa]
MSLLQIPSYQQLKHYLHSTALASHAFRTTKRVTGVIQTLGFLPTPIPKEPHVSPSMASLRRMYQPPDTAPRTRAPSVASESEGHSSIADGEESVHKDFQDPDVPDLPPDRELHPMPPRALAGNGRGNGGGDGGGDGGGGGGGGGGSAPCLSAANLPANNTIPEGETLALSMLHSLITSLNGIQMSIAKPAVSESGTSKAKLRDPDTFDGSDPRKLQSFLVDLTLIFADR